MNSKIYEFPRIPLDISSLPNGEVEMIGGVKLKNIAIKPVVEIGLNIVTDNEDEQLVPIKGVEIKLILPADGQLPDLSAALAQALATNAAQVFANAYPNT